MRKHTFILLALIPLFMGCKEITLNMGDSGKTVTVAPGTTIKIELVSNKSTGNSWREIDYNHEVIELAGNPVYKKAASGLTGAPGTVVYTFKAGQKGQSKLQMQYGSPDNPDKKPVKSFELLIVVE